MSFFPLLQAVVLNVVCSNAQPNVISRRTKSCTLPCGFRIVWPGNLDYMHAT
ncbi:hypothetical protein PR003_g580 [Phytophthora rubi]|uniref:RxLR effector protein n=1 Tax=Phytophthora rubi TaxID=129364 RepID=A0A6A4FY04_9STRA|nr:hypothetical protein PR002_g1258 [Phytophthora rubi]KAE9052515.1 hypothetical protein PR001_g431 [Phytophthora rubi]KAE9359738.1 hypothetical protein PR003_g580 [Phytophthora rubi]